MRGIESKEKKIKDYDLRSKVKVQQISGCSKQKLESKEQLRLKTALLGKRKMSRIPRPIKKESDIINQQESVKKGYSISIQHQSDKDEMRSKISLCLRNLYALNLFPKKKMSVQQEIGVIKMA